MFRCLLFYNYPRLKLATGSPNTRLLKYEDDRGFIVDDFIGRELPKYAILSHTWGADDEEVTLKDLKDGTGRSKAGYRKLIFCAKQVVNDKLQFFWVDTCCIDKSSSAELSEAINSMFRWYRNSARCYVYLSDVSADGVTDKNESFRKSRWFTRGWTLQELVAPRRVEFFSKEGIRLGDKDSFADEIATITNIPIKDLKLFSLSDFSVEERMSWARGRQTKREEDIAYSLLGIFDIHMSLIYGEGRTKALNRLKKKISQDPKHKWTLRPPIPAAKPAEEFEGNDSGEVAWMSVVERWRRDNRCFNCGSKFHWEDDCQENCGKCLFSWHTVSWCGHQVRCKKCNQQGHLRKDCTRQRFFR